MTAALTVRLIVEMPSTSCARKMTLALLNMPSLCETTRNCDCLKCALIIVPMFCRASVRRRPDIDDEMGSDTDEKCHKSGARVCARICTRQTAATAPHLRVLQIEGRVDLVKDVDGRGLEAEQREDKRQRNQRALAATERLQTLLPHLPHGHLDDEPLLGAATFRWLEHRPGGGQQRVENRTEILVHLLKAWGISATLPFRAGRFGRQSRVPWPKCCARPRSSSARAASAPPP